MSILDNSIDQPRIAADVLHAYLEASDEIQTGIKQMLDIVYDADAHEDERVMALHTLADALFPHPHDGQLGLDLEESEALGAQHADETRQALDDMDREEETFATRLRSILQERGLTQVRLAEMSGVGQPAIANMLLRQCRPQRRTVVRLARALDLAPVELWPGFVE